MIYKIYEGLSDYLIALDGTAINKATTEVVKFERTALVAISTAKLITDETYTFIKGKKKPIRLVRRFTREQLVKMYNQSKHIFKDDLGEVPFTQKIQKIAEETNLQPKDVMNARVELSQNINHIKNPDTPVDPLVIPEGMVLEEAGTITQEQLDQLAASKRKVKSNPKASKAKINKVQKAMVKKLNKDVEKVVADNLKSTNPDPRLVLNHLKGSKPKVVTRGGKKHVIIVEEGIEAITAKTTPVTMKLPFLKINGVDYQSARQASKALDLSVNTVLKRAKANKDGWFYIEA